MARRSVISLRLKEGLEGKPRERLEVIVRGWSRWSAIARPSGVREGMKKGVDRSHAEEHLLQQQN